MLWLLSAIWSILSILYFSCFLYRDRFGKVSSIILLKIFLHVWLGIRLLLHLLYITFVVWYYPQISWMFSSWFFIVVVICFGFWFVLRVNISLTGWTIPYTLSSRLDILSSTWSKSLMRLYSELFVWIPESFHFKFYFDLAYSAPLPTQRFYSLVKFYYITLNCYYFIQLCFHGLHSCIYSYPLWVTWTGL